MSPGFDSRSVHIIFFLILINVIITFLRRCAQKVSRSGINAKLKHRYERGVFGLRIAPKATIVLWLERSPVLITIGMFSEGSKLLLSKRK